MKSPGHQRDADAAKGRVFRKSLPVLSRDLNLAANLRIMIRWVWIASLHYFGFFAWARKRIRKMDGIVVVTLHRVLSEIELAQSCSVPGMIVREHTFDALARYVRSGCSPIPLIASQQEPEGCGMRIAFTSDDGWQDNVANALPIARRYGIPLTIFICPGVMGAITPFWPERAAAAWYRAQLSEEPAQIDRSLNELIESLKQQPVTERNRIIGAAPGPASESELHGAVDSIMSWPQARMAAQYGVSFGSHTYSHRVLTQASTDEVTAELVRSRHAIWENLSTSCTLFAYPNGDMSPAVRELVGKAGYQLAFSTRNGVWFRGSDPLAVPRINLWEGKLLNPRGGFSGLAFEYAVTWKAYLGSLLPSFRRRKGVPGQITPQSWNGEEKQGILRTPLVQRRNDRAGISTNTSMVSGR